MGNSHEARSRVSNLLTKLDAAITSLPASVPEGTNDGPLAIHLADLSVDEDEGPYFSFNRPWERVFQRSKPEKRKLVARGEYGLVLAHGFVSHFVQVPGIEKDGGLDLIAMRLEGLLELISEVVGSNSANPSQASGSVTGLKLTLKLSKRPRPQDNNSDDNDNDYVPPTKSPAPSEAEGNGKKSHKSSGKGKAMKRSKIVEISDSSEEEVEEIEVRAGRPRKKAQWALEQFHPTAMNGRDGPIWKWSCRWCDTYRTSKRTQKCTDYENETIKLENMSNFISHAVKCTKRPGNCSFEAWSQQLESGAPQPSAQPSGVSQQRQLMKSFIQRGLENPAKEVTRRGFRQYFVKGLVEDDLPFSLGEKSGMKKLLGYMLPTGYTIPGHSTVRRDLDLLQDGVNKRINTLLQENQSQIAISSDLWSSKNSVYSFLGSVAFWIDDNWELQECPIELIPLDGDHSGRATGKLLFQALRNRKLTKKIVAHTTDNTASNTVMNESIVKRLFKKDGVHTHREKIQVGCAAHVLNLVVQAIQHGLGDAPDPDDNDLFEVARQFPIAYVPEDDPEVQEEMAKMKNETDNRTGDNESDSDMQVNVSSGSSSESDSESVDQEDAGAGEVGSTNSETEKSGIHATSDGQKPSGKNRKLCRTQRKRFTVLDKLHAIVVDTLSSEPRRRRMRRLIRRLCAKEYQHLVPIRSMPIRWNTTHSEIQRAIKIRPAISQWVESMDQDPKLTGKRKRTMYNKKKKLQLTSDDWDFLEQFSEILILFYTSTLSLQKKGIPTICQTLPLYKMLEKHLEERIKKATKRMQNRYDIKTALASGLKKLNHHLDKALESDFPLLGAVLHPSLRLGYFQDTHLWSDDKLARRARVLLDHIYDVYLETARTDSHAAAVNNTALSSSQASPSKRSAFMFALKQHTGTTSGSTSGQNEVEVYLSGLFPSTPEQEENPLLWWKQHSPSFPVLSRIARDILAIPGVSVSVERLFSSSKHTLSDSRSSMTAETASSTILTKEWLKLGLGEGIDYLAGITIH